MVQNSRTRRRPRSRVALVRRVVRGAPRTLLGTHGRHLARGGFVTLIVTLRKACGLREPAGFSILRGWFDGSYGKGSAWARS